ncbi:MAG: GNAT family protein [Chloroflexota bacterium]
MMVLSDDVLRRRAALPVKPEAVTLEGRQVRLAPLDLDRDTAALHEVKNGQPITLGDRHVDAYDADTLIWRWMFGGPFASADDLRGYLKKLVDAPNGLAFCVWDKASNQQVGVACLINNSPADLKIELGSISYSPIVQRTGANTEATYLMLKHVFDLGYRRAEWKCNALNQRSRHSALRMGFQFEGIQEAHMIVKNANRDTAWFRILEPEWGGVKQQLETMMAY